MIPPSPVAGWPRSPADELRKKDRMRADPLTLWSTDPGHRAGTSVTLGQMKWDRDRVRDAAVRSSGASQPSDQQGLFASARKVEAGRRRTQGLFASARKVEAGRRRTSKLAAEGHCRVWDGASLETSLRVLVVEVAEFDRPKRTIHPVSPSGIAWTRS
jgi:hypothetical protein